MILGLNANGQPIRLSGELRAQTNMHVIGGSGTGKSKFLETLLRDDLRNGKGLCLIDWHGTLCDAVLRYCAQVDIGLDGDFRRLVVLNPSRPNWITGFNPFVGRGQDISTQVSRRIDATIRPWGVTDTNQTPTLERICRALFTFMVETGETLPNVAHLLQSDAGELRRFAAEAVTDRYASALWQELLAIRTDREWREQALSTANRLGRFLSSSGVRRFMGLAEGNIDLMQLMDEGGILLVNLGASEFLPTDGARVFASLLLNEFFEGAMRRANQCGPGETPKPFVLYLDEFQEYITEDVAAMLDQVRKGGLHMVLAHQHLGHFADNPRLRKSVLTNARIRAVFGGLDYEDACLLANEMFLADLNTRQIKKAYYHTIHLCREETREIRSHSTGHGFSQGSGQGSGRSKGFGSATVVGSGVTFQAELPHVEGWFGGDPDQGFVSQSEISSESQFGSENSSESWSEMESEFESEGETEVPVWVPIPVKELASETEWSREEKLSKIAEMLKCQQRRHCFVKLDTSKTQPMKVPFVRDYLFSPEFMQEYEREVYERQGALPAAEVDRRIEENERRFLEKARGHRELPAAEEFSDENFLE